MAKRARAKTAAELELAKAQFDFDALINQTPAPKPHASQFEIALLSSTILSEGAIGGAPISEKAAVILRLFYKRWYKERKDFHTPEAVYVTEEDITEAIREIGNLNLKGTNPFNFIKDFIRPLGRNLKWPNELHGLGISVRQVYSQSRDGRVFEFIRYKQGQTLPFPNEFPHEHITAPRTVSADRVGEISMECATPRGGYVSKVLNRCLIIEEHLNAFSPFEHVDSFYLEHIEDGLKGTPEIDSFYIADFNIGGKKTRALIGVEIKTREEAVLGDQIRGQIVRLAHEARSDDALIAWRKADYVIAMAVAPRMVDGKYSLCLWSLDAVRIRDARLYQQHNAHQLEFKIRGQESVQLNPVLNIF